MKITLIGGGSYAWGPKLINDLCLTEEIDSLTLCLHDVNHDSAELIRRVGVKMAEVLDRRFDFEVVDDLAEAVRDAFVVAVTISTGGLKAMAHDLSIPERYGIFHTVGDTVGPGGWARSLRNIPVFENIGAVIREHAPHAWVFNYSNPMAPLSATLSYYMPGRVTGCCHSPYEPRPALKEYLGLENDQGIVCETSGVNHFFWMTKVTVDGQDVIPLLVDRRDDPNQPTFMADKSPLFVELWRIYECMPYIGDRHTCEFLSWAVAPTEDRLRAWSLKRTPIQERYEWARQASEWIDRFLSGQESPKPQKSGEVLSDAVPALAGKTQLVDVLNVINRGQCPQLPMGALVETAGVINGSGLTPLTASPLPGPVAALVRTHAQNQMDLLEAVRARNWEACVRVLRNDPVCSHLSPDQVRSLADEFRSAHREFLEPLFEA
jgi:alpha-galactosidase